MGRFPPASHTLWRLEASGHFLLLFLFRSILTDNEVISYLLGMLVSTLSSLHGIGLITVKCDRI